MPSNIGNMLTWPVYTEPAQSEIDDIRFSHVVHPILVIDILGNRIKPEEYEEKLKGATVDVYFYLRQHFIHDKKKNKDRDTFSTEIVHMQIISPPTSSTKVAPSKRKSPESK